MWAEQGGGGAGTQDMTFSILETPDWEVEAEMAGKFRNDFAFDERERLLGCECLLPNCSKPALSPLTRRYIGDC